MTRQALYCTIVLSGWFKITAGEEGFSSEAGPFSVLAAEALTAPTTAPYGASPAGSQQPAAAPALSGLCKLRIRIRMYRYSNT